ncbi:hypothetical protein ACFQV2_06200 [Actinokineospora soli]|uniref:FXSXX-COOH protein n=1 Tax=Actinokineospora soli TaxID=1048753 RepID=A0ABW2TID1_9PSEU
MNPTPVTDEYDNRNPDLTPVLLQLTSELLPSVRQLVALLVPVTTRSSTTTSVSRYSSHR